MTDTQTQAGVVLTDVAVQKVRSLLDAEGRDDLSLRIAVQPGGCSGLRYQLYFDDRTLDGDVATDYDGVTVVTAAAGRGPYRCGNSIDSGSVGTPGSQRTGAVSRPGSMRSSTRSWRPAYNRLAGRCTCSGVDK